MAEVKDLIRFGIGLHRDEAFEGTMGPYRSIVLHEQVRDGLQGCGSAGLVVPQILLVDLIDGLNGRVGELDVLHCDDLLDIRWSAVSEHFLHACGVVLTSAVRYKDGTNLGGMVMVNGGYGIAQDFHHMRCMLAQGHPPPKDGLGEIVAHENDRCLHPVIQFPMGGVHMQVLVGPRSPKSDVLGLALVGLAFKAQEPPTRRSGARGLKKDPGARLNR